MRIILSIALFLLSFSPLPVLAEKGTDSGLPTPRFASLKRDEAHMRTGPSTDYPIKWTYKRRGLPVEILREYNEWRKIRDPDGESGWVNKILLSGERTVVVKSTAQVTAWTKPDRQTVAAKLDPGALAHVEECTDGWCLLSFSSLEGWVEKKYLWGIYQDELLN